jgi:hypothetical protein
LLCALLKGLGPGMGSGVEACCDGQTHIGSV